MTQRDPKSPVPSRLGEVYQVMAEIGLQHVERLLAEDCPHRERRLAQRDALLALLGITQPKPSNEQTDA